MMHLIFIILISFFAVTAVDKAVAKNDDWPLWAWLGLAATLAYSVAWIASDQGQQQEKFMRECSVERKHYECVVLWRGI